MTTAQMKPQYKHDCERCVYVLSTWEPGESLDWYVHPMPWRPDFQSGGTVVARRSDEGSDYWAMPIDMIEDDDYLIVRNVDNKHAALGMVMLARTVLAFYRNRIPEQTREVRECSLTKE